MPQRGERKSDINTTESQQKCQMCTAETNSWGCKMQMTMVTTGCKTPNSVVVLLLDSAVKLISEPSKQIEMVQL